jgi:hypothetical protein
VMPAAPAPIIQTSPLMFVPSGMARRSTNIALYPMWAQAARTAVA